MAFAYSNFAKINEKVKVFCTAHGHPRLARREHSILTKWKNALEGISLAILSTQP